MYKWGKETFLFSNIERKETNKKTILIEMLQDHVITFKYFLPKWFKLIHNEGTFLNTQYVLFIFLHHNTPLQLC